MDKPRQSRGGLFSLSFGFFGIQIGFALQNANMSRVFQTLGADVDHLAGLWVAAPLTGLIVQPIVGHLSDRTWLGWLGRRRPYFLAGALLAAAALVAMPHSTGWLMAAGLLWLLDASLNISMEPFRALIGDMLPAEQHAAGYAIQTAFIGAGAVVGSLFPYVLARWAVANTAPAGVIPETVRLSFLAGAIALVGAVLWTVLRTREYPPERMGAFHPAGLVAPPPPTLASRGFALPALWIAAGGLVAWAAWHWGWQREVCLLGAVMAFYGLASALAIGLARAGRGAGMLSSIVGDFTGMPPVMRRLALVQFLSWFGLFIMWVYTTPIVAQAFFATADPASPAFQAAGNWVGVLFTVYNAVATIVALAVLPWLARRIGQVRTHMLCLAMGAAGFASFLVIGDATALIASEIGIGVAWASILAMPYAILASSLPPAKLGIYMGLFNIFIVIPQLLVATVMGTIMHACFPGRPIWLMAWAAGAMLAAAVAMGRVRAA